METAESVSYWVKSCILNKMQFNEAELSNMVKINHQTSPPSDWDTAACFVL